jgi:WD40 repeat protein
MAFSPDDHQLAVASQDASVPVLIDINSGRVQEQMSGGGHRGGVDSVAFARTGRGW